jgi:hypothetical protein
MSLVKPFSQPQANCSESQCRYFIVGVETLRLTEQLLLTSIHLLSSLGLHPVTKQDMRKQFSYEFGRDSSVGIALGYGLDDRGSRVRFPAGLGIFLFTTASRTAPGLTHLPIQWVPGALSLEVKRPGREADHSPPSSAEVKE